MSGRAHSAGLLLYRRTPEMAVFLVHPGGPFYSRKDEGVWSIPKGMGEAGEEPIDVAKREFHEETGHAIEECASGPFVALGSIRQKAGKNVDAWAVEGDWPIYFVLKSNSFTMEWPPHSGRQGTFPEVDRGAFFPIAEARKKINPAQCELIDRLLAILDPSAKQQESDSTS